MCTFNGELIVAGGSDSWNCLNSVELYCPIDNVWKQLPSMSVARRGAGMSVFKGEDIVHKEMWQACQKLRHKLLMIFCAFSL